MSDETEWRGRTLADGALLNGLLALLKAKGLLSPGEIEAFTDTALLTIEGLGPTPVASVAHQVVENVRTRLLAPLPPKP